MEDGESKNYICNLVSKTNMKKFCFLLSLGLFLFMQISFSQAPENVSSSETIGSLSGLVLDALDNQPLPKATIYIPDLKKGTAANNEGSYKLSKLPKGKYLVEVSYTGYGSSIETIEIDGEVEKLFYLSPTIIENRGVTVTGVSGATQLKKTPVPITLIKKEALFQGISSNLVDALSKTPGVSQISTGPAISKPSIRGLGYNRVVVINDGIRQEGQQWGDEHGIEIDEYNVSKAEVLKGPASIMYGSDALAGVVNIISILPVQEGTIKGNIFGNYQTNNRLRGFHGDVGGNNNGFVWGLYGSLKYAADYHNKYDGAVFNSRFNEKDFGGYIGLNKSWGFTHLLVSNFNQRLGVIEGERDDATGRFTRPINNNGTEDFVIADNFTSTHPAIPQQHVQHFKVTVDNSFNIGKNRFTFNTAFQRNRRNELGDIINPQQAGLSFDLKTINYNLQYHFAEKNNWKTTAGINGMQQSNTNKGNEQIIPDYNLFDIGGFLYTQKSFEQLTLSGGIRFDNRSIHSKKLVDGPATKFSPFTKDFSNLSASIGLSYEASSDAVFKFNIARGFRAPGIPELASNGAHEGTNRYEYGEQNLKSEISYQVDGGFELNTEHISLNSSIFYNAINHFIYYRKLSSATGGDSILTDGGNQLLAFRFDQVNAKLYGIEFNLDIHPHPLDWLHFENTFSYVRGLLTTAQDGSKNIPFIPAARLINELKGDFLKKGKSLKNLYVKIELDNTFNQNKPFTGYNTETKTPAYHLLNAGMGVDILSHNKPLFNLYFAANNLTDVAYQSHLSRLKYTAENQLTGRSGVYNMGRNFSVKINVPFNIVMAKP